jgi:ABC-type anion transport system duplicated permease subunit
MSAYEIVSTVLAAGGLIISTVVLVFLLQQVRLLARQVEDSRLATELAAAESETENVRRKQRATMEFLAATLSKIQDVYDMLPPAGSAQLTDFVERAMLSDSREFLAVRNYLNFLEDLCSGVTLDVFDKQVIFRLAHFRPLGHGRKEKT